MVGSFEELYRAEYAGVVRLAYALTGRRDRATLATRLTPPDTGRDD